MLYRPTSPPFPRERLSPSGVVTATAIHVGLLWLLLQYSPLAPTIRYVVYQYAKPISPSATSSASRAISVQPTPQARSDAPAIFSNTPDSSVPLKTTTQLPDTLRANQPQAGPRETLPAPAPEPQPAAVAEPAPAPAPVPLPPVPVPEPVPAPVPVEVPAPAPVPVPAPAPVPVPAPAPVPVPAPPAPVPPAPAPPAPTPPAPPAPSPPAPAPPAPVAAPTSVPPAPALPAPPAPPAQRLQGPVVDVPVQPGTPGASTATPVLVAPPGGGWGTPGPLPGTSPAPAPRSALPPAPVLAPAIPPHPGPFRVQPQRSLAEMANEQLRRPKKDPLAQGMENAAVDDCLRAGKGDSMAGGLLAAPILAARALGGRCPK